MLCLALVNIAQENLVCVRLVNIAQKNLVCVRVHVVVHVYVVLTLIILQPLQSHLMLATKEGNKPHSRKSLIFGVSCNKVGQG